MRLLSLSILSAVILSVLLQGQSSSFTKTDILKSADHEITEGYFTFGDEATLIAKPGSDLHSFLSSHRGQRVRLTIADAPTIDKIER